MGLELELVFCDGEVGAGAGGAGENGGGDVVFDGLLDDAAEGAGAEAGVVATVDEEEFGVVGERDGDFLGGEGLVDGF